MVFTGVTDVEESSFYAWLIVGSGCGQRLVLHDVYGVCLGSGCECFVWHY